MIVGSAVLFAVNGIAAKSILASGHLDATRLVSLQTLFAAVVLLAMLAILSPRELRPGRPALVRLATLGVLGSECCSGRTSTTSSASRSPSG